MPSLPVRHQQPPSLTTHLSAPIDRGQASSSRSAVAEHLAKIPAHTLVTVPWNRIYRHTCRHQGPRPCPTCATPRRGLDLAQYDTTRHLEAYTHPPNHNKRSQNPSVTQFIRSRLARHAVDGAGFVASIPRAPSQFKWSPSPATTTPRPPSKTSPPPAPFSPVSLSLSGRGVRATSSTSISAPPNHIVNITRAIRSRAPSIWPS